MRCSWCPARVSRTGPSVRPVHWVKGRELEEQKGGAGRRDSLGVDKKWHMGIKQTLAEPREQGMRRGHHKPQE